MDCDPWTYTISVGLGYLVNHVVSTKFAIDIALFSSYCVISNHPVTGYHGNGFRFKFSFFLCVIMT